MSVATGMMRSSGWRLSLANYAQKVSGGAWKPYDWSVYLSRVLQERLLEGDARIIVSAPPRHGKSLTISNYLPAWYLEWHPENRILLTSAGANLPKSYSKKIRAIVSSDMTWARINPDTKAADDWETDKGGGMRTGGVDTDIIGRGGQLIIIDDPYPRWSAAQSATYRKKVIDWFDGTLYHRLEPGGSIVLVMTRWHPRDLAGYLLEEHEDEWEELLFPAIAEKDDMLGREVGEALCPERFTTERLLQIRKAIKPRKFVGLYQQKPVMQGGEILEATSLRFWYQGKEPPQWEVANEDGETSLCLQRRLPDLPKVLTSWDFTFKGKERNDFVAGHAWGYDKANRYLLDRIHDKMGFKGALKAMQKMQRHYPDAIAHLVEDKANGSAILETLQDEIASLIPVEPDGSKIERFESVVPIFDAGNVYLPHPLMPGYRWVIEVIDVLCSFPSSDHDDDVDATSQALNYLRKKGRRTPFVMV